MNAVLKPASSQDCAIADLSLAAWGRKEIRIAETEMPGLMAIRAEYAKSQPLKGARITGSLHMTIQTAVLIETLQALGATGALGLVQHLLDAGPRRRRHRRRRHAGVRRQGRVAGRLLGLHPPHLRIRPQGQRRRRPQHDPGRRRRRHAADAPGPEGREGCLADQQRPRAKKSACLFASIKAKLAEDPTWYTRKAAKIIGVTEETTTGVHRLNEMSAKGTLLFRAINVNDCVTKSKFDNLYGCRESLVDGIKRATDVMIAGKVAVVAGYGDVGKGSAQALRALSAQVWVTEIDPINALQAAMEGYRVVTMEYAADKADIFVTTTGNKNVITHDHMAKMKDQAIVCNIGHFDNEIDVASLEKYEWEEIKPQVDHVIFPDGKRIILLAKGRLVNLGCGTGHPSYVMSSTFANQTIAQIELFTKPDAYQAGKVYVLPKHLDEKVARLQLSKLGAQLTVLTDEQAAYIGVDKNGPYKPDTYRY